MFKLSNQVKIISICLFIFAGLLFFYNNNENNKKLYAFPGIDLNLRKHQLEEEMNILVTELTNVFNNMNLNSSTRLNRMQEISRRMEITSNNLQMINQQITRRDIYYLLRSNNNQNQPNN
ncbi:MAG: SVM family protein [Pigeon pea little leaf phytoplasma]|uniref:SVM family protein n=1 Tax=Candidatus Phytoplasma fabacearum TaxID=2982628 RepID=A0ABU8ZSV4_9MOLU|nr:SVM family protein ['Bituminaria bituminosa' little leaf phytoplasma]MDV3148827.1 SVM family protein [Pigeon pea little leaf phytoplasma]MDO7983802.1 SVM family protein ['Bituminaria bituminosa' little leaf phytoplasma]MDO8024115.1 SVM family protein ['Bituminaria bituminosa' little leaf phytoplasma]MDO8030743.1 SVM family protein ['Bituminaria bituminosa' little leaf phytoplasma]MDV3154269.1 SVM family protein [Pigeon pea little leaf phytoplasma]